MITCQPSRVETNFEDKIKVLILMSCYLSFGILLLMRFNLMPLVIHNDNIQNT